MRARLLLSAILTATAAILVSAAVAAAAVDYDSFQVTLDGANGVIGSTEPWHYYPNTDWWNTWYYNDPLSTDAWKRIEYNLTICGDSSVTNEKVDVVINYSTNLYINPLPPLPELEGVSITPHQEAAWINRQHVIYSGPVPTTGSLPKSGWFDIPDYNPEWVSIDVRTYGGDAGDQVNVTGDVRHMCLPKPPVHEPLLNWDFVVPTTPTGVNNLEIVVDSPNFNPDPLAGDVIGVSATNPTFHYAGSRPCDHDGNPLTPDVTILTWDNTAPGAALTPGSLIHAGLNMGEAGRILDAYWTWTWDNQGTIQTDIVKDVPVIDEETWTWRNGGPPPEGTPPPDPIGGQPRPPGTLEMRLGTDAGFSAENEGKRIFLDNIRTYYNIPEDVLDLEDLNADLDEGALLGIPGVMLGSVGGDFNVDSFFDVFFRVEEGVPPQFLNPDFEALLVAEVWVQEGTSEPEQIGTFWNLNEQCPEPATLALMGLGAAGMLLRRKRR